ncbi:MAG: DUF2480 family protein [Bacteroidia bacterium]|nr:DUF2480 family protein [Bacteroidia bacterium]
MAEDIIRNKVAESGILTIDPAQLINTGDIVQFDLRPFLFEELILKEKDFREKLKHHDWEKYTGKNVAVFCSADAIIPSWAYMLTASSLQPYARTVFAGTADRLIEVLFRKAVEELPAEEYRDKRIVIKGCSDIPLSVYSDLIMKLQPVVISIMYGEPCSTVPVFKKKD